MKRLFLYLAVPLLMTLGYACTQNTPGSTNSADATAAAGPGQAAVQDDESEKNVLQIALGSKDHTTLVAAVQAAELENALVNAGPFTVFAPTDAAFAKVPKETLDDLMKPENKNALSNILEYHVYVGVINENQLRDGLRLNQVNLKNVMVTEKDGKFVLNGSANILAAVPASNGIVYVIDEVLLPPE
ncbi:MAG: fasciclin domain-containing protein [Bacteroidetes bacterium]|nr:MAG: fasciclin domain-containing protein [Bacteroidota bacterium]